MKRISRLSFFLNTIAYSFPSTAAAIALRLILFPQGEFSDLTPPWLFDS